MISADTIALAKDLVASLERGDEKGAKEVIDDLTNIRESDLYQEMGKLTRELHDAITAFGMDEQISTLAQQEIPDARQRLRSDRNQQAGRERRRPPPRCAAPQNLHGECDSGGSRACTLSSHTQRPLSSHLCVPRRLSGLLGS